MDQEVEGEGSSINISDVIEVIQTDPAFGSDMTDRGRRPAEGNAPSVRIIEQPAPKALRFRYECEGRSAGSIPGVNSTPENKTYPKIGIFNYRGRAMVLVSCVTKDPPYRPHPHNLVGKENCKKGVCTVEVDTETMTATFANLGIQCVKKRDIEEALRVREELRIDPFRTGFSHRTQAGTIDLNSVRLCFQVFLEGPRPNEFKRPITPAIVSEPIYDKKAMSDLVICKLSECSSPAVGGKEIILLCEKVAKEDISVRFYEEQNGHIVWEGYAEFTPTEVHKQVAIVFRTPKYKTIEIEYPIKVSIQLLRPSDHATSAPRPFLITPHDADHVSKRKRQKCTIPSQEMLEHLQGSEKIFSMQKNTAQSNVPHQVKLEPNVYGSPIYTSPVPSPADYGAGTSGYNPPVYHHQHSPGPAGLQPVYSPMHEMSYAPQASFSPSPPVQQVDVQMNPLGINSLLDPLQLNRISPQNVLQPINDLNTPQVQMNRISSQNVLQPTNDLNAPSVQMNQLSTSQKQNVIQQLPPQQMSDELNTPTVSATGIEEHSTNVGNTFGDDSQQRIAQLNSSDLACILADMDTGTLSQNLSSNLTFD